MAITIKDVAKLAGVGVGTASRAISGNGAVSPLALAKVQSAVQTLGFHPSNVARALSIRQLGMIGVYVPVFEGSFYSPILQAIDGTLRSVGRHMMATSGHGEDFAVEQALQGLEFLFQRQCDGVLALSSHLSDVDFLAMRQKHHRLVALNRTIPGMEGDSFSADHEQAGRLAARALLSKGHRKIATIHGIEHGPDVKQRMKGFNEELALHGVQVKPKNQANGNFTYASGWAAAGQLLQVPRREFTAVFCAADIMAMAAIQRFSMAGLRVPEDLSVMGYDDLDVAAFTTPALTTVHLPISDVAINGCRHLINQCYDLKLPVQRTFASHVVWRDSVAPGPFGPMALDIPSAPVGAPATV